MYCCSKGLSFYNRQNFYKSFWHQYDLGLFFFVTSVLWNLRFQVWRTGAVFNCQYTWMALLRLWNVINKWVIVIYIFRHSKLYPTALLHNIYVTCVKLFLVFVRKKVTINENKIRSCVRNLVSGLLQIAHKSEKWQWSHNFLTWRHCQTFLTSLCFSC